jgi:hypothetical protein
MTLDEGLEWARELAVRIVEGGFWTDEEIVMEHTEKEFVNQIDLIK